MKILPEGQVFSRFVPTWYHTKSFSLKIRVICLLMFMFTCAKSQVYYPAGVGPLNFSLWLDASDAATLTLVYNSTGTTGTGTAGSNTITSAATIAATTPIGSLLRLGSDVTRTYTVTGISGTTIVVTPTLGISYSNSIINSAAVSLWKDKSGGNRNATQLTVANQPSYLANVQNGLPALGFPTTTSLMEGPSGSFQTVCAERLIRTGGGFHTLFAVPSSFDFSIRTHATTNNYGNGAPFTTGDWASGAAPSPALWINAINTVAYTPGQFHALTTYSAAVRTGTYSISTTNLTRGMSGNDAVGEIVSWNNILNVTRRQLLEAYLGWKWGNTPGAGPYVSAGTAGYTNSLLGIGRVTINDSVASTRSSNGLGFELGTGFLQNDGDYLTAVDNNATGIGVTNSITRFNRTWRITKTDVNANGGNVTLFFDYRMLDNTTPSPNTANYQLIYNASNTTFPVTGTTTIQSSATVVSGTFVKFTVNASALANGFYALKTCNVSSAFSYAGAPFCVNAGSATITLESGASAGNFTALPSGLSITASTGTINLNASAAGTYTVTNTVTGVGGCTSVSSNQITIIPAPSATISYSGNPYCSTAGTANVTFTGTTGGTYTSTSGLDLNATTGAINPAASAVGTYTVSYNVAAAEGCTAYSTTTSVTIKAPPDMSAISRLNIIAEYKFSGNANDATGVNNGTLQNGPAPVADRFNIASSAFSFNGSTQYVSTANPYTNPTELTISAWFKTTTVTGGNIISFGSSQTGSSGQHDRHLYMNNEGKIYFGIFNGTVATVNSALSYNDGNWHLATASLSATAGMVLYMDGVAVGTNSIAQPENYTGYWRLGYENLSGWTSQPTSFYFNGLLDDALIYHRVVSAAEVALFYTSPDGAGNNGPVCSGAQLNLTAGALTGATYLWTGPNGFTSTARNPSLTYSISNAGIYNVVVTVAGCTAVAYTNVVSSANAGQWVGNVSTDWNNAGNWCDGVIPTSTTNVIIPAGVARMPLISGTATCSDLTINPGATLTTALGGTLNIAGKITNSGTMTNSGTTAFVGTTGQQTFVGVASFFNLVINNLSGLLLPGPITLGNELTIAAGNLNSNNFAITIAGKWTNNVSPTAFVAGSSTVSFNSTSPQTIGGTSSTTFNNLFVSDTGTVLTLAANVLITGYLTVAVGTLDLAGFNADRTTAGSILTVSNNAILKIGGTNTFPLNYSTSSLAIASTVEYSGTNQAVATKAYGNLMMSSAAGDAVKTMEASALVVAGNLTLLKGAGNSVTFVAAAAITVNGNVSIGASTTFNGGSFIHNIAGNWVNQGSFAGNTSTIRFTGLNSTVSGAGVQNFNNLTVAAMGVSFTANNIQLTGNLATTGVGAFTQAAGGNLLMSGTGTTISGQNISLENLTVSGTVTTASSFTLTGNLAVSGNFSAVGGTIILSGVTKTISGAGVINFNILSVTGSAVSSAGFSIGSALNVNGVFSATAGSAKFTGTSTLSGTANLFNVNVNGTSLTPLASSQLGIAGSLTMSAGVLAVLTSGPNTVNFNGAGAQVINAISYDNLLITNSGTKTAAGGITVHKNITLGSGITFNPGSFTHSIGGDWINNSGTFAAGTGTIRFAGATASNIIGATTFNILTLEKNNFATTLILQSNATAAILNMVTGNMTTGANRMTITSTRTGNGIIMGNIQRTHLFTSGVSYAFEGPENTILFSAVNGVTSMTVSVVQGSVGDFPFGGSINRVYNITVPAGTYIATLRLHYTDAEINGNDESSMGLWQYNGAVWTPIGKTGNNVTSDYVEQSGLTNITNRWTLSDDGNVVQWNGSVSSDWNTAANWTVLQGSGSRPPVATDIVNIGAVNFNNQPTISTAASVKNITLGSVKAVTLSMAAGGSLITGNISGDWTTSATHTLHVGNQAVTINGDFALSNGTPGQVINVNIGSGSVTIAGSLNQLGGAAINVTGTGTINIGGNFNYTSGVFAAGSGTVNFNGAGTQAVGTVTYNHLVITKAAGLLARINNALTVNGNLTVSTGQLENMSDLTVSGNVVIASGGTLINTGTIHVNGNWLNSGTFTPSGSGVFFEGTANQTISASNFGDLIINKPSGTATLTGHASLSGNLSVLSGNLDLQTFNCNRTALGGTITVADGSTLLIGGNNGPVNFATITLGINSTVIYNGTSLQTVNSTGISFGHVIFRNGGSNAKVLATSPTVSGNLTIESGATLDGGTSTITLWGNWVNNGSFTASTGSVMFAGQLKTISGNTTFYRAMVTGKYNVLANLTYNRLLSITSTGSITSGAGIVSTVEGDLTNRGILNTQGTATFTGTGPQTISLLNAVATYVQTVNFMGTVSPVLTSTSSPQFVNLNIFNTGGVYPSIGWTVFNALTIGPGAAFFAASFTHVINGNLVNNGKITSSGTIEFIPSVATTINLGSDFTSTGVVTLGGSGVMTLLGTPISFNSVNITNTNGAGVSPASNWNLTGNFVINPASVLNAGAYSYNIGGNINFQGIMNKGTSSITLNGTGAQEISTASTFHNLTLNKSSGLALLATNASVSGTLNFLSGIVQTGSRTMVIEGGASLTGASQGSGWVNGNLQKNVATGAPTQYFEVGDMASYTPVTIAFSNVSTAGSLSVKTTASEHPDISNSNINPSKSVNRYWSFVNTGIVFTTYTGTFNFVASDIDAGATTAAFKTAINNGASWGLPVTASPAPTSIQATGVNTFGDIAIGEVCNASTSISYAGTPYCANGGSVNATVTGTTGGSFSSSAGVAINALTGAVNLGSSVPGTYNIMYTVGASSDCPAFITSTTLTVNAAPAAVISYAGTPFCVGAGNLPVTRSGTAGGQYTSVVGLSLNDSTGSINLGTSTPGTYTISYTFAASGGCSIYSATTSVTIVPTPDAPAVLSPVIYCQDAVASPLTATGTNLAWGNGAITGSVGNPTSLNSVVYIDNANNNKKTEFKTHAANVVISTVDFYIPAYQAVNGVVLAIYDNAGTVIATSLNPLSQNAGASAVKVTTTFNYTIVTQGNYSIGLASGTGNLAYSNPAFPVNEASGTIQITGVSVPGVMCFTNINFSVDKGSAAPVPITGIPGTFNFVVRQVVNGCISPAATITVIVSPAPSATITYADTLFCKSAGVQLATRTGTEGGRFTSGAGLSIDSTTGTVTPATSTAGAYTVTYSTALSGGCEIFSTTARVIITAIPSASISYGIDSYCSSGETAVPTRAGTQGGVFTAPAGVVVNSVTGDINLYKSTPGTYNVSYTIAASGGCSLFATTAAITITAAPIITQLSPANLVAIYKFEGNANDVTGNNNGTLQNNPAPATDRFNNTNKAYSFDGTTQYISTANSYVNPTEFTVSIWFKTTTTTGGKLIGFSASQTGLGTSYDRDIYMNNAGQIYFGIYGPPVEIVSTASSYNDGSWHLATASLSATNGMVLYMDGVATGSNPARLAENFTGYWRIGFENVAFWPSEPSSSYFSGILDDVVIYHRAISAAEVGVLFNSPDGAAHNGPVCFGSSLNLAAPSIQGATYLWTGPNGYTSALQNPVLPFGAENAGTYSVAVTASGCTTTAYTNVTASTNSGQWTGNVSTDWNNSGNWCNGVIPVASTNVLLNAGAARMPSISAPAFSNNITINAGATLTITGSNTLTVSGNLQNNGGSIIPGTGTVNFNAASGTQLLSTGGSSFHNILHSGAGTLQLLAGNLVTGGYFTNEAGAGDVDFVTNGVPHTSTGMVTIASGNYRSGAGAKNFNGGLTLSGGVFTGHAGSVTVSDLTVNGGNLVAPAGPFNVKGSWINNGGNFTPGLNTVIFSASAPQLIGGSTSTLFHHVTINNAAGITAGDITVNGVLNLQSPNPSATSATLDMGLNTLNMGATATNAGPGDVTGIVRRTTLLPNVAYTFGNLYTTATFQNLGTIPAELSYKIRIGNAPAWKTDGINRVYDIAYKRGIGFHGTAKFHYLDSELNGNTESQLVFFRYVYDSSFVFENGRSNFNTTENWIELSNLTGSLVDSLDLGELEWTLADQLTTSKIWAGTMSNDWFNPLNWTGGVPGPLDKVVIPDAFTTDFDPLLPDSTTISSITIDSAAILDGGTGRLFLAGADGSWLDYGTFNYGTSTVTFTNAFATMAGTSGFYNITIDAGAELTMGDGEVIRIYGSMTNNGSWSAGFNENAVHYAGGDQVIVNPNGGGGGYSTLVLEGTGIKTMPLTIMAIRGDFSIEDMLSVTAGAALDIEGTFKLGPTTTFNAGGFDHSVEGDWDNSGNFIPGSNTILLNGDSVQNIKGSSASSFNNLTVDGGGVLLASNVSINTTLTLSSGTVNLGANILTMGSAANAIAGSPFSTANMIIADGGGEIRKAGTGVAQADYFFPVGDNSAAPGYSPVGIDFTGGNYSGYAGVRVFAVKHPSNADTGNYLNRYWTIFQSGYTGFEATVTAFYVDAGATTDVAGSESNLAMAQWTGVIPWKLFVSSIDSITNTLTATGVTSFGDFSGIDMIPPGQLNITASAGDTVCINTVLTLTVEAAGGSGLTYFWSNGLGTGKTVTAPTSTPGTTTYSVTVTDGNGFATSSEITIVVNPLPVFTLTSTASEVCYSNSIQSILLDYTDSTNTLTTYSITWDAAAMAAGMVNVSGELIQGSPIILTVPAGIATGVYTGSLTAGNAEGCISNANTFTFRIGALPQITWRSTALSVCASELEQAVPLYFTSMGDSLATYNVLWDNDAAATAAGFQNVTNGSPVDSLVNILVPPHAAAGVYTGIITVFNANGCQGPAETFTITVNALPDVTGLSITAAAVCSGEDATISVTGALANGDYTLYYHLSGANTATGIPAVLSITSGKGYFVIPALLNDGSTVVKLAGISGVGNCNIMPANGDTTTLLVSVPGTWLGTTDTNWFLDANWCGGVPLAITNVFIRGNLLHYPQINAGTPAINNLTVEAGGSLTINDATLQIAGLISNLGSLSAVNGNIEFNGTTAQVIPAFTFTGNTLKSLTINNAFGVTLGGIVNLTDQLTVSSGALNTGGFLVLKSSATATATVAPISSAAPVPVNGAVTVERYIPGRRKYRLISSSVTSSTSAVLNPGEEAASIWGNWQNSGDNITPNSGNLITGGSAASGFDTQTSNSSLYTYNDVSRSFSGFNSANGKNTKFTPLTAGVAYYMFVYGDRRNTVSSSSPNHTVLRAKGTLLTGDQTYNTSSGMPLSSVTGRYTLLGNPFASPVDWATMVKTDISNTYWGWDPNLSATGGYITINTAGTVTLISPFSGSTGLNQFIQPGQGFFVKTTGASPVLTIREQDKVATFNANAFRTSSTAANDLPLIAINLTYTNSGGTVLADGTLAAFDPSFSPGIGEEDAVKIAGSGEGIAIMNSGELLSIDARPMPKDEEMILLNTTRLTKPLYTLQIFANEMQGVNVQAYLEDAYLNTTQPLSLNDTNLITFNVSQAQSASFALNRFRIVFRKVSALPVRFLSLAAERQANGINLKWQVAEESGILTYDVERAANGIDFKKVASMSAVHGIGNGNGSYAWSDQNILEGDNNYRILAREKDGRKYYSKIVVVTKSRVKPEIKIYPNPVLNQKIQLMFIEMDRGEYQVSVHNTRGQQMLRLQVDHPGGTTKHPVPLVQNLPPGIYYLHVARKNYRYRLDLVIE